MSNSSFANKFLDGKITLIDGREYRGLIKPPVNQWATYVEYKDYGEGKIEKLKIDFIKEIVVISNGVTSRFLRLKVNLQRIKSPTPGGNHKYQSPLWLIEKVSGYATLYSKTAFWKLANNGVVEFYSGSTTDSAKDIYYYGTKKGDSIPRYLSFLSYNSLGQLKAHETYVSQFVADYPELVERIQSGEFKPPDVTRIIKIYNQYKGRK